MLIQSSTNLAQLLIPGTQFKITRKLSGKLLYENLLYIGKVLINNEIKLIFIPALTEEEFQKDDEVKNFQFHKEQYLEWSSSFKPRLWFKRIPRYFDFKNIQLLNESEMKNQLLFEDKYKPGDNNWYQKNLENINKFIIEESLAPKGKGCEYKEELLQALNLKDKKFEFKGRRIISNDGQNQLDLIIFEKDPITDEFMKDNERTYFAINSSDIEKIISSDENMELLIDKIAIYKIRFSDNEFFIKMTQDHQEVEAKMIDYDNISINSYKIKKFFLAAENINLENEKLQNFVSKFQKKSWPDNLWKQKKECKAYLENLIHNNNDFCIFLDDVNYDEETLKLRIITKINNYFEYLNNNKKWDYNIFQSIKIENIVVEFDNKINQYHIQYQITSSELDINLVKKLTKPSLKKTITAINLEYQTEIKAKFKELVSQLTNENDEIPISEDKKAQMKQQLIQQMQNFSNKFYKKYPLVAKNKLPMLNYEITVDSDIKADEEKQLAVTADSAAVNFQSAKEQHYQLDDTIKFTLKLSSDNSTTTESKTIKLSVNSKEILIKEHYQKNMTPIMDELVRSKSNLDGTNYKSKILAKKILNLYREIFASWNKNKYYLDEIETQQYSEIFEFLLEMEKNNKAILTQVVNFEKSINNKLTSCKKYLNNSIRKFTDQRQNFNKIINNMNVKIKTLENFYHEIKNYASIVSLEEERAKTEVQIKDKFEKFSNNFFTKKFNITTILKGVFKKIFYWSNSKYKQNIKTISDKFHEKVILTPVVVSEFPNFTINNTETNDIRELLITQNSNDSGLGDEITTDVTTFDEKACNEEPLPDLEENIVCKYPKLFDLYSSR